MDIAALTPSYEVAVPERDAVPVPDGQRLCNIGLSRRGERVSDTVPDNTGPDHNNK